MSGAVAAAAAHAQQQPKTEPGTDPVAQQQPLPMIAENYSTSANRQHHADFEPSKQQQQAADSADRRSLPYPHSMPTSPTMFERGNESRYSM